VRTVGVVGTLWAVGAGGPCEFVGGVVEDAGRGIGRFMIFVACYIYIHTYVHILHVYTWVAVRNMEHPYRKCMLHSINICDR